MPVEIAPGRPDDRRGFGDTSIRSLDWKRAVPGTVLALSIFAACWPLVKAMPDVWFGYETYYAHGAVVPFCVAFLIWDRWPSIRKSPVRGSNWALVPIVVLLLLGWPLFRSDMHSLMSLQMVLLGLCSVLFVAGWYCVRALTIPAGYLLFGLPVFGNVLDRFTLPLQKLSTDLSFRIFELLRMRPVRLDADKIALDNYTLYVAVPCSGLHLLLAVMSIVVFFVLIARLRWWANLIMLGSIVPLSLFVNAIRISGIGLVGNTWGNAAGLGFHDYSGYISLIVCFGLLYTMTRGLGWRS